MKKWLVIILVVVLLLLAAGGLAYYKFAQKAHAPAMMDEEHGGVFGSIQDALAKKLSLQCHFTSGNTATTAYIKMGSMRVDNNEGKPDAQSMIMRDKKIYFWQVASKKGTVIDVPSITVTPAPTAVSEEGSTGSSSSSENEGANALAMLEKFKDSCKVAGVADSLFTPPSDVAFTDMSKMMPSGVPSGMMPSGASQEQIRQMMQQYGAPTGY